MKQPFKAKVVKTLKGHRVKFSIDQQTFSLPEQEGSENRNSEDNAKWYKTSLEIALRRLYEKGVRGIIDEPKDKNVKDKYKRSIKGVEIDVYDILRAFAVTDPGIQYAIKKLLLPGKGLAQRAEDLMASKVAIDRAFDFVEEDEVESAANKQNSEEKVSEDGMFVKKAAPHENLDNTLNMPYHDNKIDPATNSNKNLDNTKGFPDHAPCEDQFKE